MSQPKTHWRARLAALFGPPWALGLYGLILLIAALLRFTALTQTPHTLWVDEAWFGLMGREVVLGHELLPLREPNSVGVGNSPFQIYASAAAQAVGVPAAYSSRAGSAVVGWLMLAVLYPTLLLFFRTFLSERQALTGALVATAALTTQFAALFYSRDGGQNAACAFAAVLVFLGLYQTFQQARWRWAILSGLALALSLTTYEAALGLALACVVYVVIRVVWPGDLSRGRVLALGGVLAASALVAFAPILLFYIQHPTILFLHFNETQNVEAGGLGATLLRALAGLWKVLLGISLYGDVSPGHNLVGLPFFDPAASVLLWAGLVWLVWRTRHRPAAQVLFTWVGVMALPSALSTDPPSFPRMLAMIGGLAALAGVGAVVVGQWAFHQERRLGWVTATILGLGLVAGSASSLKAYFSDWPNDPRSFDARYAGARLTADNALTLAQTNNVLITARSQPFIAMQFDLLLGGTPVQTFDASPTCLPYVNDSARATDYGVVMVINQAPLNILRSVYPQGSEVQRVIHPAGYAYSLFYEVPAHTPAPAPSQAVNVQFENGLQLVGYDFATEAKPNGSATLKLYWQTSQPLPNDLVGFVHLGKGANSQPLIANQDAPLCPGLPTSQWQTGFRYIETRTLTLAADAPPDHYDVRVGVYNPAGDARLTIVTADVPTENNRAQLAEFTVH